MSSIIPGTMHSLLGIFWSTHADDTIQQQCDILYHHTVQLYQTNVLRHNNQSLITSSNNNLPANAQLAGCTFNQLIFSDELYIILYSYHNKQCHNINNSNTNWYSTSMLFHLMYEYSSKLLQSMHSIQLIESYNILYITHISHELHTVPILPDHITALHDTQLNNIQLKSCHDINELYQILCGVHLLEKLPILIIVNHCELFIEQQNINDNISVVQLWRICGLLKQAMHYVSDQLRCTGINTELPVHGYININDKMNSRYEHIADRFATEFIHITNNTNNDNELVVNYKPVLCNGIIDSRDGSKQWHTVMKCTTTDNTMAITNIYL